MGLALNTEQQQELVTKFIGTTKIPLNNLLQINYYTGAEYRAQQDYSRTSARAPLISIIHYYKH